MTPGRLFVTVVSARPAHLVALLGCATAVAAGELAIPWLMQGAVDAALGEPSAPRLDRIGITMLAIIGALYVVHALLLVFEARVLYEGMFRLRRLLYARLLARPLAFFHRARTGELVHRIVSDTGVFEDSAVELFSDLPFEVMTVGGVLTLMLVTQPRLALLVVAFLAAASAISAWVGRPLPTLRKSVQALGATFTARLQESIAGIRTVKAFGAERSELERLDDANRRIVDVEVHGGRIEALLVPVFDLMELLGVVLVVWYGGHLILDHRLTPGGLVAFIAYMEILAGPVSRAGRFYRHFLQCRGVSQRLSAFLTEEPVRAVNAPVRPTAPPLAPWWIEFADVRFSYPGSDRPAIDALSLKVAPGELVALVGRNGAGKTTLVDLLQRMYDPTSGAIRVGGVDLREWDLDRWRAALGVMPQETYLFHASVAENIAYARRGATRAGVEASAREAGLAELIARLPDGLDTVVGDRGSRLSGGERQRIALARLWLRAPAVLVLDEPTAHLDGEAVGIVGEAMRRLAAGRTAFVIAHRHETVALAQRIVLLDRGCVVASGAHEELLAGEPLYRTLLASLGKSKSGARA